MGNKDKEAYWKGRSDYERHAEAEKREGIGHAISELLGGLGMQVKKLFGIVGMTALLTLVIMNFTVTTAEAYLWSPYVNYLEGVVYDPNGKWTDKAVIELWAANGYQIQVAKQIGKGWYKFSFPWVNVDRSFKIKVTIIPGIQLASGESYLTKTFYFPAGRPLGANLNVGTLVMPYQSRVALSFSGN